MPRATTPLPPTFAPSSEVGPVSSGLVLPAGRPANLVAFEASVVDFFVNAAGLLGVPKSVAAIYGVVFASPVPLSFAVIESRLNFSKGSISSGLRLLREAGAIREVSTAADRAELFTPDLEMRKLIQHFIHQRLERQLEQGKGRLKGLTREAGAFAESEQKVLRQRLEKLAQWHDRTRQLLPVAKAFLNLGG
jgi:DNA-binding transcriptional regulator GbsR (MarR family)